MQIPPIRIRRDESGATAVEYGLIGALLALGLVGALVTTKGSLNADYTCIASYIGNQAATPCAAKSATVGPTSQRAIAPASSSSRASYWGAKTLATKTVTNPTANSQLTQFTFTDGTTGSYLANFDNAGNLTGEVVTTYPIYWPTTSRTLDSFQVTYGADGSQVSSYYADHYATGVVAETATAAASNNWYETVNWYNANGSFSSTQSLYDSTLTTALGWAAGDEVYFRALANQ